MCPGKGQYVVDRQIGIGRSRSIKGDRRVFTHNLIPACISNGGLIHIGYHNRHRIGAGQPFFISYCQNEDEGVVGIKTDIRRCERWVDRISTRERDRCSAGLIPGVLQCLNHFVSRTCASEGHQRGFINRLIHPGISHRTGIAIGEVNDHRVGTLQSTAIGHSQCKGCRAASCRRVWRGERRIRGVRTRQHNGVATVLGPREGQCIVYRQVWIG